jgi:hypothetical protein
LTCAAAKLKVLVEQSSCDGGQEEVSNESLELEMGLDYLAGAAADLWSYPNFFCGGAFLDHRTNAFQNEAGNHFGRYALGSPVLFNNANLRDDE